MNTKENKLNITLDKEEQVKIETNYQKKGKYMLISELITMLNRELEREGDQPVNIKFKTLSHEIYIGDHINESAVYYANVPGLTIRVRETENKNLYEEECG